jgi:hypothetical protein
VVEIALTPLLDALIALACVDDPVPIDVVECPDPQLRGLHNSDALPGGVHDTPAPAHFQRVLRRLPLRQKPGRRALAAGHDQLNEPVPQRPRLSELDDTKSWSAHGPHPQGIRCADSGKERKGCNPRPG